MLCFSCQGSFNHRSAVSPPGFNYNGWWICRKKSQKTEKYKRNVYIFLKYIININRYIFILNKFADILDSEKIHLNARIWRTICYINTTAGIHLRPVRRWGRDQPATLHKVKCAHFWPRWNLESSKHVPAWQAGDDRHSVPALPGCLAGLGPRGQGTEMDGPVSGSLLPRWLTQSAGSPPEEAAPWRHTTVAYANFHLYPPLKTLVDHVGRNARVVVLEPGSGVDACSRPTCRDPLHIKNW